MEETTSITTRSVGIRYGLILALVSVIYFLVLTIMNVDMTSGIGRWASILFYVAGIFLAHKYFKDNGSGFMSYGEGIGISFWIGLLSSVISSLFTYIYIKFIDSSFVEMIKEKQIEEMQARGMSDEQIDQGMKFAEMFMSPEAILIFGIIGGIITVLIVGLIVTIFTQKKSPEPGF
ncbi:MAG: DUF4199 domain-containing protein [Cyclobacteriaceae bacterium]|jgi:hypothetical protein|nr:DUF4199 domain-containing protein [Cyclobacteriaceae bacterium]